MTELLAPAPPGMSFLATFVVEVAEPVEIGSTPEGTRRIIPIVGGRVEGPELRGTVLPVGADFQLLSSSTLTELEAKYAIETDEGDRIYVTNFGLRSGTAEDIARLVDGKPVPPERIYFRCTPRLTAPEGRWSWLRSRILVGTGERLPGEVRLTVFVVD
ncbi:DUF3237 domain-containing protein [Rhodococcus sp. JS3073]|uniref:DUF3237 domain-containing protein n=1 Tax=Rhodococcus sp. JS3073 TaxID=3002901 RepID=UPI00228681A5|nr:DUF3237 domain-containing protein [Rhodococcus sp. JS3073]WAM17115.1 DUF3237 domain-containing protein [Rhodococcus sp. JS3073]